MSKRPIQTNYMATVRRLGRYMRSCWLEVILSLALATISVALTLYVPVLIGRAIDHVLEPGQVGFAAIMELLIKAGILAGATAIAQWLMNACNNAITFGVVRDIRADAFRKIQELPLNYLDSTPAGEIVSRVVADVDQLADGLLMGVSQLFSGAITILGTLLFMLSIHPGITMVVVCITPLSLFAARFIASRTSSMFHAQSDTRAGQTAFIDELLSNLKAVKAFGREAAELKEFDEINERLKHFSLRAVFYSSISNPVTRFITSAVYAGVVLTGALSVVAGGMSIGALTIFLSYANQYTKPFNEISGVLTELQNAIVCAGRVLELIDEEEQVPDAANALVMEDPDGSVKLDDVYFSYNPSKKLIEHFCLDIKPGQRIAIVGPTGCGKTTLINLLMRFYDVSDGAILVEGTDIRDITRHSMRGSYGMVLQDTWLQTASIRDNIALGKPDATLEEVQSAAKAVHADSFIRRLPQGYDTVMGEDGGSLSQGQRQLLCIARIMLCLPPMLILDEATSSIDTRTEQRIQQAFARLTAGRTSFIVAHRLSTIREADVIVVMRDGHVVEQGSHSELLAKGGFYSELYYSQFAPAE